MATKENEQEKYTLIIAEMENNCSIGMFVVGHPEHSYLSQGEIRNDMYRELEEIIIHKMGFNGKEEYTDLYPGNYMSDSLEWFVRNNMKPFEKDDPKQYNNFIYLRVYDGIRDALKGLVWLANLYIEKNDRYNYMPIVWPTIKEMKKVRGFKSVKAKDLWMCSDWKE